MTLSALGLATEPGGIWLDVPFVAQQGNGCGAACISMVMRYWSRQGGLMARSALDAAAIQRALYSKRAKGIPAAAMQKYLEEAGFRTFVFRGEWVDLRTHLSKGRPLIVCIGENGRPHPLHYVVVTGLDWQEGLVVVNDPAQRKLLRMDQATFERGWGAMNHWTLLALPRESP